MDYNELLFAFHVRDLAAKRLGTYVPKGLTEEAEQEFRFKNFDAVVHEVVEEISGIAEKIRAGRPAA